METWELLILLMGIQAQSVIECRPSVTETESPSDTAFLEADQFLTSYGYYPSSGIPAQERNPSLRKHSDTERAKALKLFQKFYNLPQSGQLDKETTRLMQSPRCGNPDITPNPSTAKIRAGLEMEEDVSQTRNEHKAHGREKFGINVNRERRYLLMPPNTSLPEPLKDKRGYTLGWRKPKMTWYILQLPNIDQPNEDQRLMIRAAMFIWQVVLPIEFVEETRFKYAFETDMKIWFHSFAKSNLDDIWHSGNRRWFNDKGSRKKLSSRRSKRKTGPKRKDNRLAHVALPATSRVGYTFGRDIHFDADHKWTYPELLSVALHEIGHAVGLGHSTYPDAIMYPYNRNITTFSFDDLNGVWYLYRVQNDYFRSHLCNAKIREVDAIFRDPNSKDDRKQLYYAISGTRVQRFGVYEVIPLTGSVPIDEVFPGAPSKYDVVFSDSRDNSVFFIKGNRLYQYKNNKPLPSKPINLPETPTFAVTVEVDLHYGKETVIIIFGKRTSWHFVFDGETVKTPEFKALSEEGYKTVLDAKFAVQWPRDGPIYAINPNNSFVQLVHDAQYMYTQPDSASFLYPVHLVLKGDPFSLRYRLCQPGHATCIRISARSLVLLIILSRIKLY